MKDLSNPTNKGVGKVWFLWRLIPHSHGTVNMRFIEIYPLGEYEIWECSKCKFREAV